MANEIEWTKEKAEKWVDDLSPLELVTRLVDVTTALHSVQIAHGTYGIPSTVANPLIQSFYELQFKQGALKDKIQAFVDASLRTNGF